MNKKIATVGISLGLLAGGAAGFVLGTPTISAAQESTTTIDSSTDTADTADTTKRDRLADVLGSLVTDGTLTQAQLDAVLDKLETAGPLGGRGGHGGGLRLGLETAATALGVTADELRTELAGGSSIADVAAEQGVSVQTVIDAIVAEQQARLAEKVAAGDLTQAEADERLATSTERITAMVNGEAPLGGRGGMGGRGGRDHHDHAADADDTSEATTTTTG